MSTSNMFCESCGEEFHWASMSPESPSLCKRCFVDKKASEINAFVALMSGSEPITCTSCAVALPPTPQYFPNMNKDGDDNALVCRDCLESGLGNLHAEARRNWAQSLADSIRSIRQWWSNGE